MKSIYIYKATAIALSISIVSGCGEKSSELDGQNPEESIVRSQVSALDLPATISHRGGSSVYPEESMEGFSASADAGFLPEMDIQFLSDGTPVLNHDDTADRTLNGVSGQIRDLTREQWDEATIKHPTGGPEAETVTLEELLDELGGSIVMVPEIKPGATSAEVGRVLNAFDDRGLRGTLIVQSFDFDVATRVAERGYDSLYLIGRTHPAQTPEEIAEAGIGWIGPSTELPREDMEDLIDSGFNVAPYTLPTASAAHDLPDGVAGYFTDDAWTQ